MYNLVFIYNIFNNSLRYIFCILYMYMQSVGIHIWFASLHKFNYTRSNV